MINNQNSRKVALIFEKAAAPLIDELAGAMPVWVIRSPENDKAADVARLNHVDVTVFFERDGESKLDTCARLLLTIDEHHQFDQITIYGALSSEIDIAICQSIGVTDIEPTDQGCRLSRPAE
ncbi:hypothetical protein [Amantichitinum ursilacus]|uniref:Uncharacterized protein n=1 Tax=Amantichitinum ursilacus TaxID=857265 RepID=A0A0N0GM39_9NEIS|nr:hypothetical protein [Amantichitinum ursilacus]KPC50714.1 hypothetical protein WG78_16710 [Amantichitinum ursilacus]